MGPLWKIWGSAQSGTPFRTPCSPGSPPSKPGSARWGNEANERRPFIIVSIDRANAVATRLCRGVVTVVPVTSNTRRIFPFQVLLTAQSTGLPRDFKAQAEQVRSIAVERLGDVLGRVPADAMQDLDDALRLHLQL